MSVPAVQWLLRSLPAPCETNQPYSTAPVAARPCPWVCQIKPQPSTGRLPTSAPVPGQGWAPGSRVTGLRGVNHWHISLSPSFIPLVAPSKLFWCHGGTSVGHSVLPTLQALLECCWITGGVTEGKSHISMNGDNYCSNRYKSTSRALPPACFCLVCRVMSCPVLLQRRV